MRRMLSGLKDRGFITQTVGREIYVSERLADVLDAAGFRGSVNPADLMGARLLADLKNRDVVRAKELCSANLLHVSRNMLGY